MGTITIKINNSKALNLLKNLEELNIIEVIKKSSIKSKGKKVSASAEENVVSGKLNTDELKTNNIALRELFLNGPVYTDEQIKAIEDTRKSINKWRTK